VDPQVDQEDRFIRTFGHPIEVRRRFSCITAAIAIAITTFVYPSFASRPGIQPFNGSTGALREVFEGRG